MDLNAIIERVAFVEPETLSGYVEIGNTRELLNDVWKQIKKQSPQAHQKGSIGSHKMEFSLKRSVNEIGVEVEPKITNRNRGEVMLVVRMRLNEGEEEREDIDFEASDTVADAAASVLHSVNMNLMRRVSMKKIARELLRVAKIVSGDESIEARNIRIMIDKVSRVNDELGSLVDRYHFGKNITKILKDANAHIAVGLSKMIDAGLLVNEQG